MERGKRKKTARLDSNRQTTTDADTYNFLKKDTRQSYTDVISHFTRTINVTLPYRRKWLFATWITVLWKVLMIDHSNSGISLLWLKVTYQECIFWWIWLANALALLEDVIFCCSNDYFLLLLLLLFAEQHFFPGCLCINTKEAWSLNKMQLLKEHFNRRYFQIHSMNQQYLTSGRQEVNWATLLSQTTTQQDG